MFKKRENVVEIEEGNLLSPKFDNDGLIPVITMCAKTKEILMHGYMNVEALKKTIETKEAHYFSRSRNAIWHKGKTSGFTQKVNEIRTLLTNRDVDKNYENLIQNLSELKPFTDNFFDNVVVNDENIDIKNNR